jgi:hypothetical protein
MNFADPQLIETGKREFMMKYQRTLISWSFLREAFLQIINKIILSRLIMAMLPKKILMMLLVSS